MTAPDDVTATVQEALAGHTMSTADETCCSCGLWFNADLGAIDIQHEAHVAAAVVAALGLTEEWGVRWPLSSDVEAQDEDDDPFGDLDRVREYLKDVNAVEDAKPVHRFTTAWTEAT